MFRCRDCKRTFTDGLPPISVLLKAQSQQASTSGSAELTVEASITELQGMGSRLSVEDTLLRTSLGKGFRLYWLEQCALFRLSKK